MILTYRVWAQKPGSGLLTKSWLLGVWLALFVSCSAHKIEAEPDPRDYREQLASRRANASVAPNIDTRFAIEIDAERVDLTREYFYLHNRTFFDAMPSGEDASVLAMIPKVVVVHFTAIPTLEETLAYFTPNRISSDREMVAVNGDLNVGIQFIVDKDGQIYQSYPENAVTRHVIGLNHVAIGIENVGESDLGQQPNGLTKAQLQANVQLIAYLLGKYPTIDFVIGHSEYRDFEDPVHPGYGLFTESSPNYRTQKVDPGPRFMLEIRKRLNAP